MDRFARTIIGYHGCRQGPSAAFAQHLLAGETEVRDWQPSDNEYDWLGDGIYFWEHGPERARDWAGPDGVVVGAVIQLGNCLDLTDVAATQLLSEQFEQIDRSYRELKKPLPTNLGGQGGLRKLDCLVINELITTLASPMGETVPPLRIQTVRGAFEEGKEAFAGSMIKIQTHIQIAVRDHSCILGVFRPNLDRKQRSSP